MLTRANVPSFARAGLYLLAAILLCGVRGWAGPLPDSYPRLFFNERELDYARAHLGEKPWSDILSNILDVARHAGTPRIDRDYTLADIDYLYSGPWFNDVQDSIHLAMAWQLTGDTGYRDRAIEVVRRVVEHIDTTPVPNVWWITIKMDLMGLKTLMTFDLVRSSMSDQDVQAALAWFKSYSEAVKSYQVAGSDGGYYSDNKAGGNIKSWDDAMIGCTGLAAEDEALVRWALEPGQNGNWVGSWIAHDLKSVITNSIVEEWSGANSQYGPYRIVDWYRAVRDGKDYIESVSYQAYHAEPIGLFCEGLRQHHIDMYRYLGLSDPGDGDGRHHLVQTLERLGLFLTLQVAPEHNQFRTWNGNDWVYTDDDRYAADLSIMKLVPFVEALSSRQLQAVADRYEQMQDRGLHNGHPFRDFHFWGYLWPLKLWHARDLITGVGTIRGRVSLLDGGSSPVSVRVDLRGSESVGVSELVVPAEPDGSFVLTDLPPGTHLLRFEADGYRPQAEPVTVGEDEVVDARPHVLEPGVCTMTPQRGFFLHRRDISAIEFIYVDPDGWTNMPDFYVFTVGGAGNWVEVYPQYSQYFNVIQFDDKTIHLQLPLDSWPGWATESLMLLVLDNDTSQASTTWVNYPDA